MAGARFQVNCVSASFVLPGRPLSNRPSKYVREWLLRRAHVEAIVSLPRGIFSRTTAKTSIVVVQRRPLLALPYRGPTYLLECDDVSRRLDGVGKNLPPEFGLFLGEGLLNENRVPGGASQ